MVQRDGVTEGAEDSSAHERLVYASSEHGQRLLRFFLAERLAVVVRVAAEQALNRVTLDSTGDDGTRPAFGLPRPVQRGQHLAQVVAVDFLCRPAKRLELRRQ